MAGKARGRVTVIDVARHAGVSQATVSAALHGRGRVGEACRRRVEAVARQLGYQPRTAAQLLRAHQTNQLGAVVAATDSLQAFALEVQRLILGHFVQLCAQQEIRYMIEFHHHVQEEQGEFLPPHQVTARMVDGTLLAGDVGGRLRHWLGEQDGFPWVSLEEDAPYCVLSAAEKGLAEATRLLLSLGHRRFAYLGGPERYSQQRLGRQGFLAALAEAETQHLERLFDGTTSAADVAAAVAWSRELLAAPQRPTAIVCHSESFARAVIHAAAERGLRVPADLSVVSYGSAFEAARRYPLLTTVENDYGAMTAKALSILQHLAAGQDVEPGRRWIPPRLVAGDTVAPPPQSLRHL